MSEEERIKLIYDLKSLIQKATEVFLDNTLLDSLNEIKCLFDMGYAEEYIKNPDFDGLADAYKCFNSKNKKPMTVGDVRNFLQKYSDDTEIRLEIQSGRTTMAFLVDIRGILEYEGYPVLLPTTRNSYREMKENKPWKNSRYPNE